MQLIDVIIQPTFLDHLVHILADRKTCANVQKRNNNNEYTKLPFYNASVEHILTSCYLQAWKRRGTTDSYSLSSCWM